MASRRPKRTGVRSRFRHQRRDERLIRPKHVTYENVFDKLRKVIAKRKERLSLRGRARRITGARKFARHMRKSTQ